MKNTIKLTCLGFLAFFIFILVTAPATLITRPVSKNTNVKLEQVAGSIWKGQAKNVIIENVPIGAVAWDTHVSKLLKGELASSILIGGFEHSHLNGNIEISLQLPGRVVIENSKLQASAEWVVVQAALPIIPKGDVAVDIKHLSVQPKQLPKIRAKVDWLNAGVTYPSTYELGSYHVLLGHEPEESPTNIVGTINDLNSPLHIKGDMNLDAQGRYTVNVDVSAEDYAPEDIRRVLPFLGRQNPDGSVNIKREGSIQGFF